jgi:arsenite methyltransferase
MENLSSYLRLIQKTGATRHPGGFSATDTLLKHAELTKHSRLLDVGCGAGHTSAYIAKNYHCLVTGVDISPDALHLLQSFYQHEPFFKRMIFQEADATNLPFADGFFDVVLCESVLFFIKDKKLVLKEMARVVKSGGFLAVNEISIGNNDHSDAIEKYFSRREFGGYINHADKIIKHLANNFTIIIQDEHPIDLKDHLLTELKHWAQPRGFLQMLELFHQAFVSKEARSDLINVAKFAMDMPKGTLDHLNFFLLLGQKN